MEPARTGRAATPEGTIAKVRGAILRHGLIRRGDKVLVAFSGGADSCCLLHALKALSGELGFGLGAAHVNHGYRGESAERDAERSAQICEGIGVELSVVKVDVHRRSKESGESVELAARNLRHGALKAMAEGRGYASVAMGHNMDDQVETVVGRILRGTGIEGLAAMRPRAGTLIRPLLSVGRAEIEGFCRARLIPYVTDETNLSDAHARNRIRNALLPAMREAAGADVAGPILRLSELAWEDSGYMAAEAGRAYAEAAEVRGPGHGVTIRADGLLGAHPAIAHRMVRMAAAECAGGAEDISYANVADVMGLARGAAGSAGRVSLPHGLTVRAEYGRLTFTKGGGAKARLIGAAVTGPDWAHGFAEDRNGARHVWVKAEAMTAGEARAAMARHGGAHDEAPDGTVDPTLADTAETADDDAGDAGGALGRKYKEYVRVFGYGALAAMPQGGGAGEGERARTEGADEGERARTEGADGVGCLGLTLRPRREGDRFTPKGGSVRRRLKSVLSEGRVPEAVRDAVPLLAIGGEVLWVIPSRSGSRCLDAGSLAGTPPGVKVVMVTARIGGDAATMAH
ncbi:MAG: tRNA lysidine(34) synthetase TilS [Oscillospiraceae bacterium]|nr:tRNA lysidine(34) synthetase TilS [Oscillospiraceae bacterium]